MAYYEDYIREKAEQVFDQEKATFAVYDREHDSMSGCLDDRLNEAVFEGAMCEMTAYLYERGREAEVDNPSMRHLWDAENVENIYITTRGLTAPVVIVEYDVLPPWFSMKNSELREFYYYPKPGLSGEWSAGYFQPR